MFNSSLSKAYLSCSAQVAKQKQGLVLLIQTDEKSTVDVLAVGAHPDDIEFACGGTLAQLVHQGYRVGIVDLTDGEPTPRCESPEQRIREAMAAAEMLGVHTRKILTLPNRRLFDSFEARVLLAMEIRRLRPSIVLGFARKTPMASPDHYQAMLITDAAIFYARLSKWQEHFGALEPHSVQTHLNFHLGFDHPGFAEFGSHITVDISKTLDQKLDAIRCYDSQFSGSKASFLQRAESHARAIGAAAGFAAGEIVTTTRPLGCTDLIQLTTLESDQEAFPPDTPSTT